MLYDIIFCGHLAPVKWLQNNLLPCPFKKLTGIDCPGCGLQRSLLALLQGNFIKSILLYPATVPLIVLAAFSILSNRYRFDKSPQIKKLLYLLCAGLIVGNYFMKMSRYF